MDDDGGRLQGLIEHPQEEARAANTARPIGKQTREGTAQRWQLDNEPSIFILAWNQ